MTSANKHRTVMLHETVKAMPLQPGSVYLDVTLGGGGHSKELILAIAHKSLVDCTLICLDLDLTAWQLLKIALLKDGLKISRIKDCPKDFIETITVSREDWQMQVAFANVNFAHAAVIVNSWYSATHSQPLMGVIADLGLSQNQIESSGGFSYKTGAELDMRYDKALQVKASDLLKVLSKKQLVKLFTEYGDINYSLKLAETIVDARSNRQISTTTEFNEIVKPVISRSSKYPLDKEFARIYQALRIAVNLEYSNLEQLLTTTYDLLHQGGVLAIISFHSGEQKRIVKFIKDNSLQELVDSQPPSAQEISLNPRAKSAILNTIVRQ